VLERQQQQQATPHAFRCGVPPKRSVARQLRAAAAKGEGTGSMSDKYPERSIFTGGWAGGEKGLRKFIEEFEEQPTPEKKEAVKEAAKKDPNVVSIKFKGRKVEARKQGEGSDPIYIGKKKGGASGELFVLDDDRKYPGRENMGPLSGVVGGFAGGERGVQQFVEQGDIDVNPPGRKQASPLVFAIIVAAVGTIGGILLTDVEEAGEVAIQAAERGELGQDIQRVGDSILASSTGMDDRTKLILEVLLGAGSLILLVTLGKSAAQSAASGVKDGANKLISFAAFAAAFGLAFKFVLEN